MADKLTAAEFIGTWGKVTRIEKTASKIDGPSLAPAELRQEMDCFRRKLLRYHATKAAFASLKTWIVLILLVAVLNADAPPSVTSA